MPLTSTALTTLVIMVTINAVNFVDGLDGLAGGIVAIASLAFFVYAYLLSVDFGFQRATLATLLTALLTGMCLGFLPHNIHPARIFMGDTGSMLIGLLLGAAMITLVGRLDPSAVQGVTLFPALLPIVLPLAVVAVPLDRRRAGGEPPSPGRASAPFSADKGHLHHRLMEMGHSPATGRQPHARLDGADRLHRGVAGVHVGGGVLDAVHHGHPGHGAAGAAHPAKPTTAACRHRPRV
ncbi:MAG: MraY family glycosyltransferase [Microthrixaceae bacterium]